MTFEYMARIVVDATIDVDDIGNFAIRANNDECEEYYIAVKTVLGWTEIVVFGPIVPDIEQLPKSSSCTYNRFEFNEFKITKAVDKFLNNQYAKITQAQCISVEEAKKNIRNFGDFI